MFEVDVDPKWQVKTDALRDEIKSHVEPEDAVDYLNSITALCALEKGHNALTAHVHCETGAMIIPTLNERAAGAIAHLCIAVSEWCGIDPKVVDSDLTAMHILCDEIAAAVKTQIEEEIEDGSQVEAQVESEVAEAPGRPTLH